MMQTAPSFFSEEQVLLEKEFLDVGFTLNDKDARIDFNTIRAELAKIDVDDSSDSTAKAWRISGGESIYFREWFNTQPSEKRRKVAIEVIKKRLSKMNCINDKELDEYIARIIQTMTADQLTELEQSPYPYVEKIKDKVDHLLKLHRAEVFDIWLEQDRITCQPQYALPPVISPAKRSRMIPKSLYSAEEDMNDYEFRVAWEISDLKNVKWWNRNQSRSGFCINGPIHAYPDMIVMLHSGKILMVETKGEQLDNDLSRIKAKIGDQWVKLAGRDYKYYMVYEEKRPEYPGAISLEQFLEIVKGM